MTFTPITHSLLSPARRRLVRAAGAAALALAAAGATAQTFDRPITLVVPFPPGGSNDIVARAVADGLARELKQTVIVENRAGAGGNLGAELVARARPDGHTLLVSAPGPLSINHHLYSKQNYEPLRDFAPVSLLVAVPIMLVANPSQPYKTVAEFVAYAKANPGKLSYGSQGNGTTSHLTMELLKSQAGLDIMHVPYRGSAPAATDLMGGVVQVMFDNSPATLPFVKSGRMQALGIAHPKPVAAIGDVSPIGQTLPGFASVAWFGMVAPAGTPEPVLRALNTAVNAALRQPEAQQRFAAVGAEVLGGDTAAMSRFMREEVEKWGRVVRAANVRLD